MKAKPVKQVISCQNVVNCYCLLPGDPATSGATREFAAGEETEIQGSTGVSTPRQVCQPWLMRQLQGGRRPAVLWPLPRVLPSPMPVRKNSVPFKKVLFRSCQAICGNGFIMVPRRRMSTGAILFSWFSVIEFPDVDYVNVVFSDPPLTEDDVPTGEWICRRCKVIPASQIEVRLSGFVYIERSRNPLVQNQRVPLTSRFLSHTVFPGSDELFLVRKFLALTSALKNYGHNGYHLHRTNVCTYETARCKWCRDSCCWFVEGRWRGVDVQLGESSQHEESGHALTDQRRPSAQPRRPRLPDGRPQRLGLGQRRT